MQEFNTEANVSREAGNLARKTVFDQAVQRVAVKSFDVPLADVVTRVREGLTSESDNLDYSAVVRGYHREALVILERFVKVHKL